MNLLNLKLTDTAADEVLNVTKVVHFLGRNQAHTVKTMKSIITNTSEHIGNITSMAQMSTKDNSE